MMADALLLSFVSIASTRLIEHISYNRILNLFYFSHVLSTFAHKTETQKEPRSIFNRSFEENYAVA